MLDAWLKSKFFAKSKSTIRHTKTRIEMVKRKRNAMLKYLKNDVADLLKTGLDINAYSRAEGLLVELNLSRCYDLLEQYCEHISNNLSVMYKQKDCPEECREAVASLIFAAARFADVPELRELRSVFTDRYGNSIECYVSKEFLQNLKSVPPTKEMKLQLMKDIASESGIEWNSKTLEQKLFNPLVPEQEWTKSRNDQKHNLHNKMDEPAQKKESEVAKLNSEKARQLTTKDKLEHNSFGGKVVPDDEHSSPRRRRERSYRRERDSLSRKSDDSPPVKDIEVDRTVIERPQTKPEIEMVPEEESDEKKPFNYRSILPPYIRSRVSLTKNTSDASPTSSTANAANDEENFKDNISEKAKDKPRSARTSHTKVTVVDDKEQKDEEEKLMDRQLMHLSRKKFQRSVNKPKEPAVDSTSEVSRRRSMGNRATSLPVELEQTSPRELSKGHHRTNSFQPDMLGSNRHVHPKLPDYDDFVARLASLREQSRE
ncbi:uncharacterized protein LOC132055476 [Lycium ferocissimum]|uniref:uncharacterized protein LOC132055476 n=1 Tax=Lycium ferocissimum TaxID=112874 RepID=UPI002815B01E|nr:uncharacterized protein LOC132055476 [Lycium ferocissimum]